VVRVDALASESVLSRLQRMVEDAQRDKAPLQRVADRISSVFVPAVLAGALVTFLVWWLVVGNIGRAVLSGLAVLLVACPCAMGLAAPVAMMVGCGRAAALGIFIRNGDVLERLAKVDGVAFDKTGTLTERHAVVTSVVGLAGVGSDQVLALASAVEAGSDHPIATAIRAAAPEAAATDGTDGPLTAVDVRTLPGVGVVGTVGGSSVRVGRLVPEQLPPPLRPGIMERYGRGETVVVVEQDGATVGAIAVSTPLRPEARPAVEHLRAMGLPSSILSGDSEPAVRSVAATLGISDARSGLSPAGKLAALGEMHDRSRRMVMVGDGVNDAPALAAADVGCAIGSGSDAALENSDVALLGNDLQGVPAAVGVASATYSVIVQNFGWAMGYNVSALPLAAFGLLDPLVAAVAMGLSSVIVVLNSLRLARLGRSGLDRVRPPRALGGRRGVVVSVALPLVLFAGLTVVSQIVSPARGQSLLPDLPSIATRALPQGGSVETYLDPGRSGVNQFHLIFSGDASDVANIRPVVRAAPAGGSPATLRQITVGSGHFSEVVVLTPGPWRFDVTTPYGRRTLSFTVRVSVPQG
jgi:heavy metal translocating P-type ATPase